MKLTALALGTSLLLTSVAHAQTVDLSPYPATETGQVQHVIVLPELSEGSEAKVEIIVGKTMTVDCNNHFFGGVLEERTAEGWGYNYYVLESLGDDGLPRGFRARGFRAQRQRDAGPLQQQAAARRLYARRCRNPLPRLDGR